MSRDRLWRDPDYDLGFIDKNWVVLRRGGDFYFADVSVPWKVYATTIDADEARRIVRVLNLAKSA